MLGSNGAVASSGARKRIQRFNVHVNIYVVSVVVMAAINYLYTPQSRWYLWPLSVWGGVVVAHAAYATGVIEKYRRRK
ncbi:hypothetical protein CCP2SC5_420006 [Azospirillaceae bacterium]